MIPPRRIVLTAMPFGYGPAAKTLAIAAELRRLDTTPAFVGSGIAYELAARTPSLFADVVDSVKAPRRVGSLIKSAAYVVSVMDRDGAALAQRLSKPFDVVDSLLWMRDEVPAPLRTACRYWAQRLDGLQWRLTSLDPRPVPVGPIIAPVLETNRPTDARARKLVVNLGGCQSPHRGTEDQAYSQFVIQNLLEAGVLSSHGGPAVVMAGARCIRRLARRFGSRDVTFVSLSHGEALAEFASAACVWTSPGLTASLECFQRGVPTLFLPPENYSQWCILRTFRLRGLAPSAFHWEDVLPGPRLRNRLPEVQRNPVVRAAIRQLSTDARAAGVFRDHLRQSADINLDPLGKRQQSFLRKLGPNGATVIAARLVRDL